MYINKNKIWLFLFILISIYCYTDNLLVAQTVTRIPIHKCVRLESSFGGVKDKNLDEFFMAGSINYSYNIKINDFSGLGFGSGILIFDQKAFLPLYLSALVQFSKNCNMPILSLQAGYSLSWDNRLKEYPKYHSNGGFYFSLEAGYKFRLDEQISVYCGVALREQFNQIYYETPQSTTFHEHNNFTVLEAIVGIMIDQK